MWLKKLHRSNRKDLQRLNQSTIPINTSKIWGPIYWKFLHTAANHYNGKRGEKIAWRSFLKHLPNMLPCEVCRKNLKESLKSVDLRKVVKTKTTLVRFLFLLHKHVDAHATKKKRVNFTATKYIKKYSN